VRKENTRQIGDEKKYISAMLVRGSVISKLEFVSKFLVEL
jgi:hypothetical protein